MKLVLVGYMGSGKSSIGKRLASALGYEFIDLDDYIQLKENISITNIFDKKGEIYFRKIERHYLLEVLNNSNNQIIALGGGTPCYGDNMKLILNSNSTESLYLKTSIPILVERLQNEQHKRPLISHLNTKNQLSEFIGKHLFERSQFYSQSNFTISTDTKSVNEIIEDIIFKLF